MTNSSSQPVPYETWNLAKPARQGSRGVVVAQEPEAAAAGAAVIESGGNAIDGAIATALALAVTEPWMSGLGGGGFLIAYVAAERAVRVVDFGMVAPEGLNRDDYPLTGAKGADLFGWPQVQGDSNIHGAKSIAVPGAVAGYGLAVSNYGRKPWSELIRPARALAERGHRVTWWTTLHVAAEAPLIAKYATSAATWLPGGLPPTMSYEPVPAYLRMPALAKTLDILATDGPDTFYNGALARSVTADVQAAGGTLSEQDLASYRARVVEPLQVPRGEATYHLLPGLTAGPTFADAMARLPEFDSPRPDAVAYEAYASVLIESYRRRLQHLGHASNDAVPSCTTHISAADSDGNIAMLTTTLLSVFGSRLVLPTSGILMNNGINWFDPRPGRPNSLAPGKRPLSNMCPMIATRNGEPWFGFGASGGRKILPAVFQLASFVNDWGMDLEAALACPRIDASGIDHLVYDSRLDDASIAAIQAVAPAKPWAPTVFPSQYAQPSGAAVAPAEGCVGAAHRHSPLATAVAA